MNNLVKKNDIVDLYIEKKKFPNRGIATLDGAKIKLKGGIKGQKVKARISKKRKDNIEATIIDVIEKSPIEVDSRCVHFGKCGGCSYQTIPYREQIKIKQEQVKDLLESVDLGDYEYLDIVESPTEFEYRNKMEFSFGDVEKGGELALGMHKKGKFYEIETVDTIISAIPFLVLPENLTKEILNISKKILKSGGNFIQMHYVKNISKMYKAIYGNVEINYVALNIPPGYVFRCVKKEV